MPSAWIEQLFQAAQVANGGVVRRSRDTVDEYASLEEVIAEAKKKKWHVIETGGQVLVLCHQGSLVIHA